MPLYFDSEVESRGCDFWDEELLGLFLRVIEKLCFFACTPLDLGL